MSPVRYEITHDPALLDMYYGIAAEVMCNEMGLVSLPGFHERARTVGFSFPLVALHGDQVVAGISPTLRHEGNQDILLPEEHGTESRLLGCHQRLARRFAWSNHAVVHPQYRKQGLFEELCCHLFTLGKVFPVDTIGITCMPGAAPGYTQIARKYGMRGGPVDVDFALPEQYAALGVIFYLIDPEGVTVPDDSVERLRAHCEKHGIATGA